MNCREFLIEFEERGNLSEPARLHLTVCTDCRKTSERQTQIWLLIEDLQPVGAPSDFDFHVKARIAQSKPSDFQKPAFLPILRYVLPLSFSVLLLGVFVVNSGYFSAAPGNSEIARIEPTTRNPLPLNVSLNNQPAFAPSPENSKIVAAPANFSRKTDAAVNSARPAINNRSTRVETFDLKFKEEPGAKENGGGSRLMSVTRENPLFPKGINPNTNTATVSNIGSPNSPDEKDTFSIIGIKFSLENGRRKVKSVDGNSIAERSGVKVGDIIEKLGDGVLTVFRGTEKIEISLR